MIRVDMSVTHTVYKLSWPQVANMCNHYGQKRIAGNVKGDPESNIAGSLIHLARELSISHKKLTEHMTWGQRHNTQIYDKMNVCKANHKLVY